MLAIAICFLAACTDRNALPSNAQIEATGIYAQHGKQGAALKQLEQWAARGSPTAQRELGITLAQQAATFGPARTWLERSGSAGDGRAAGLLGDAYYFARWGLEKNPAMAAAWYRLGATHADSGSALMLARMTKYGEATPSDPRAATQWLTVASDMGNAQAMFLLSNAYASGDGVRADPVKSRRLLEMSAQGDYPLALQALAMTLESGDAQTSKDPVRASHLIKEATDERLMNWKRFE